MVARRFYGTVTAGDRPVQRPVEVVVKNRDVVCGRARTQAGGQFMLDLATDAACACPTTRGGSHHPDFTFFIGDRRVHGRNLHMHYDAPQTMGKIELLTIDAPWLAGRR
jgi:hypothetical protein